jgi:hypothetical protein
LRILGNAVERQFLETKTFGVDLFNAECLSEATPPGR